MYALDLPSIEDRSFRIDADATEDILGKADDVILQAHFVAPVWTETAIVQTRPDPAEIGSYIALNTAAQLFPIISDDCLILTLRGNVNQLVTVSAITYGAKTAYQITVNQFTISTATVATLILIRDLAKLYGLLDYPDARRIDACKFTGAGSAFDKFSDDPKRQRPIFVMRRFLSFQAYDRDAMQNARVALSTFGPVIVNDKLHKQLCLTYHLDGYRTNTVVVPPEAEPFTLETTDPDFLPGEIQYLAEDMPLLKLDDIAERPHQIGQHAAALWSQQRPPKISLATLVEDGRQFREVLKELTGAAQKGQPKQSRPEPEPASPTLTDPVHSALGKQPSHNDRQITLDPDGYPTRTSDIAHWASSTLGNQLTITNRAAKELSKSDHPDPGRIARALRALADYKPRIAAGDRQAIEDLNEQLLRLRLRDGFSNAEYLKGQTGDAYLFTHDGRRMLLDRHLASTVSGFNDPRLVRIYYTRDTHSGKVIVGSMPYHLPTKRS